MVIWNADTDSRSYDEIKYTPRPGHSDFLLILNMEVLQIIVEVEGSRDV